jgi:hypothetical protein
LNVSCTYLKSALPDAVAEVLHVWVSHDAAREVTNAALETGQALVVTQQLFVTATFASLIFILRPAEVGIG